MNELELFKREFPQNNTFSHLTTLFSITFLFTP